MGCLNSQGNFSHWFGNIHLSGPCNRACYFCIGQHMMALDPINSLASWPLPGIDVFVNECKEHNIKEVNLTGSNTDPMMYNHHSELVSFLREVLPDVKLGIRTNGVLVPKKKEDFSLYDKASISVTSLDGLLYEKTMGHGKVPNIKKILTIKPIPIKINIVLCKETIEKDIFETLDKLADMGIKKINLREPYGQPHLGSPLKDPISEVMGMPLYHYRGMEVVYWDVHYVEVESVNLYSNGVVSTTYPVTKGHHHTGVVLGQENFRVSGRHIVQWKGYHAY